jgi:hypothetical protein
MGQLPKDPQQLAQDILAGRISIQQLQAEQARRRAAQEALRQNIRTRPAGSGAATRQLGNRQVVKPTSQMPRQARPQARSDNYSTPGAPITQRPASATIRVKAASDAKPANSAPAKSSAVPAKPAAIPRTAVQSVRALMNNPHALRSVLVLSELLDKPLSLRQDPLDRF